MNRKEAVNFLITKPYKLGHLLGFKKLTELHNEWILDMVRGKDDSTLEAHRGSYKTTCVSISLALIITLLPNVRTMFMRKTDTDVKEIIKQVQKILKSEVMQYFINAIYGIELQLTVESATEISTNLSSDIKGTSQLIGIGSGSSITGKHFDRIFTDDIINVTDRYSKAERENTKIVYQELENIKNAGGRIFNTLTPWHPDDASILMSNIKKYDCYTTGLLSKDEIESKKKKMTPSLFAANYELKHIASENVIFQNPQFTDEIYRVDQGIGHIDAGYNGEDSTAFTIAKQYNGKIYVFGKLWNENVINCEDKIVQFAKAKMCGKIHNEYNADKGFLAKDLEAKGLRIELYHESQNKYIKIASYLKAEWENVIFTKDTDEAYIQQICEYTEEAEHDDAPDSLASLMRVLYDKKIKRFGFD